MTIISIEKNLPPIATHQSNTCCIPYKIISNKEKVNEKNNNNKNKNKKNITTEKEENTSKKK